jgi:TatA/E family protein of Tat protein translocase
LRDLLGLGPAEIAITLVVALVLFGPETLKSLSKDVGKAAAELKEIPKTFKEGMDEGAEASQMSKMKAIAAEKRKKRDAADDDDDDSSSSVRPFEG